MKPSITISWLDLERLERVLDRLPAAQANARDALLNELGRADMVEPWDMPPDVVTMNSRVRFSFDNSEEEVTLTLTYPKDMTDSGEQLSVLTPVGTALLGLKVGDSIAWNRPDGGRFHITVRGVEYQPERAGELHR
ncbi:MULTISPECIES: nucleoside diphosphate kinase regulator [unclassified Massilia]|uniref:nucleoside diphosphate kinase regulator n=1 Tax=unclassified Massilia TaxID=2609279 RepID=UPI001B813D7A|nr:MULTISPECIES: nucleoside diphosphate kinase regulator [unclassified Massilia]MBQ5939240.1 nucleoside diphosphate kinase regulator [Massilia sp. AB1]MBQ5965581.1 nucleoside diphosphate kinase regulator [Massilia sp. ZL223]